MTLDQEIEYWQSRSNTAGSKAAAIVAFGISAGLRLAKGNHLMAQELFKLPDGSIVQFNPGGRFHGWIFREGPDGQLISVEKLPTVEPPASPFAALPRS